jgi:hypothetical protein
MSSRKIPGQACGSLLRVSFDYDYYDHNESF